MQRLEYSEGLKAQKTMASGPYRKRCGKDQRPYHSLETEDAEVKMRQPGLSCDVDSVTWPVGYREQCLNNTEHLSGRRV